MISKDKTYCTRGGKPVRIYATDAGGLFPVHGAILCDDLWIGMKWTVDGHTYGPSAYVSHVSMDDLAEVKPRHKRMFWFNMYGVGTVPEAFSSKARADRAAGCNRIACIERELDFEEGEGL